MFALLTSKNPAPPLLKHPTATSFRFVCSVIYTHYEQVRSWVFGLNRTERNNLTFFQNKFEGFDANWEIFKEERNGNKKNKSIRMLKDWTKNEWKMNWMSAKEICSWCHNWSANRLQYYRKTITPTTVYNILHKIEEKIEFFLFATIIINLRCNWAFERLRYQSIDRYLIIAYIIFKQMYFINSKSLNYVYYISF